MQVAQEMQQNLSAELKLLEGQLKEFEEEFEKEFEEEKAKGLIPMDKDQWVRVNHVGTTYSQYGFVYWVDEKGKQVAKWTSSDDFNPLIDVSDLSTYKSITNKTTKERWIIQDQCSPPKPVKFRLFSNVSTNIGNSQNVFMRKSSCRRYVGDNNRLLSLFNVVLPPGFGYSLINDHGWAEFHSDSLRNERENLFLESDNDTTIRSAAFAGSEVMTTANYLGREHSLYLTPLRTLEMPLTLVTFRDRVVTRTVSLEMLSLSLALFLLYLLLLVTSLGLG